MKKLILTSCFACRNIVKAGIFLLVISSVSEKSFPQNTKTDSLKAQLKTAKHDVSAEAKKTNKINELNRTPKIDSLINLLKTAKADTTKVNILNSLSSELNRSEPGKALNYGKQALKLAKRLSFKKGIANSYNNIGIVHDYQGSYNKAISYYQRALKISEELGTSSDNALAKSGRKGMSASYNNIGIVHGRQGNYAKAIEYFQKSLKIREELRDKTGISACYGNIGLVHSSQGNYASAIKYYQKSLKIYKELSESPDFAKATSGKEGMSASYNNIGNIHRHQGNYASSIKYYQKSLKFDEELEDKRGMAYAFGNIGLVHEEQGNYASAIKYYQKSLNILEELGDKQGMAVCYGNIGLVHTNQGNYAKAIEYYHKSLKIFKKLGYRIGMSGCYNNIGIVHKNQGNYKNAIMYYQKSLKIFEELGDKQGIAISLGNIASLNNEQENFHKAIEFAEKALKIAKEIGALPLEKDFLGHLSESYEGLNNTGKALEYYKLYTEAKDSLFNEEKNKQLTEMETRYQTEKKEQQIKLLNKDKKLQKTQLDKQKLIIWSGAGGLLLVLTLAFFIYRGYRQKQKANVLLAQQNAEINQQKEEITFQRDEIEKNRDEIALKNKDITDSINYAVRIQQAILPTEDFTNEILGEHFILFKPKDIVSGDFYWAAKIKNWLIVAAVDCTGHGVPGAFMSMLGVSFLNEIVRKEEITQPNQVLNELREYVISSLQQSSDRDDIPRMPANHTQNLSGFGEPDSVSNKSSKPSAQQDESSDKVKDGMDMALIVIDTETNKLQFAGANNPLYLINPNRKEWPKEVLPFGEDLGGAEIKADKMPIGIHEEMKEFTNNELQLQKGDTLYIFSDGYPDQFGGEKGKKLKYKPFKKLFLNIQDKSMKEQKAVLDKTFEDWKGDLEQLDDVVVIGIRV